MGIFFVRIPGEIPSQNNFVGLASGMGKERPQPPLLARGYGERALVLIDLGEPLNVDLIVTQWNQIIQELAEWNKLKIAYESQFATV